ncbi:MAG: hypothetical protein ACI9AD_001746, partial [Nitriliruptoraceae bacterium]
QLVLGQAGLDVNVVLTGKGVDPALGELVGDEDAHGCTLVWEVMVLGG